MAQMRVSRSSLGEVGPELNFLKNIYVYLFIWLHGVLGMACRIFIVTHGLSSCGSKA